MNTDVVGEIWIVDELEAAHGEGEVGKLIVDLLPAVNRNSVLDGIWDDVFSVSVSYTPFRRPGDQSSCNWSSLACVLVNIQLFSVVTEFDKRIDLPWRNDEIAILALITVSTSASVWTIPLFAILS